MVRRRQIRESYRTALAGVAGLGIFGGDDSSDNCWLTSIVVDASAGWTPGELAEYLDERGIEGRPMWKPMHLQPVFADTPRLINGNAEWLFQHGLTLPSGSGMSDADVDQVLGAIGAFLAEQ